MNALVSLVSIILVTSVNAQTCSVGGSSTGCTLCPSGKGTVSGPTYGADIALTCLSATTPTGIQIGTSSPNCPITLGAAGTAVSIAPATTAVVSIANGASTGAITIGRDSSAPTASPQSLTLGSYSSVVTLGTNALTSIGIGTSALVDITIGKAAAPTPGVISIYHGSFDVYSNVISIGSLAGTGSITIGNANRAITIAPATTTTVSIANGASTGTVTIGRSSNPPVPSAQTLNLGTNSPIVNIATAGSAPSAINIGTTAIGVFSLISGTINIGTDSPSSGTITIGGAARPIAIATASSADVNIAAGASSGAVTIGRSSPTPSPVQAVNVGDYSNYVLIGRNAANYVAVGGLAPAVYLGELSGNVYIATGSPSAGPVVIGNTARPITIAPATTAGIDIGSGASTSFINIGRSSPTTAPSPTSGLTLGNYQGYVELGKFSNEVYLGNQATNTYISSLATTATLTAGFRTPSPVPTGAGNTGYQFSSISLNGKYHEFYSGHCTRTPTSFPTAAAVQCDQTPIYSNTPYTTGAPTSTSGYSSGNGRFYPTQTGVYLVCVTMNIATSGQYILVKYNTGTDATLLDLYAPANVQSVGGCNMVYVASTGSAYFWIDAAAAGITPSPASTINTFAVARIG